jgi:hypothetical protein
MSRIGDAGQLGFMKLVCLIIVERRQCDGEKLTFQDCRRLTTRAR